MYTFLVFILFTFVSCASNRPVATTHTERIEERVMPVAVGADTIEIVLNVGTRQALSANPNGNSRDARLERLLTRERQNRQNIQPVGQTDTACRVPTIESVRSTRALSMTKITTDTTQTLRITLRPDTVYVPYTNHIRSDTIIAPDPITRAKLTTARWQIAILILIIIIIVGYRLWSTVNNQ